MSVICPTAVNLVVEENNENVPVNGCDSKCRDDFKDYSGSQDIFSDDEQLRNTTLFSPKTTVANKTFNSSIISLRTPVFSKSIEETPGKATVPKTPADLLPFINKPSLLWTSDMETPEGKSKEKAGNCDKTDNSVTISCTPPQQKITNYEDKNPKNMDVLTSPVLGGKKRSKRCAKRRILTSLTVDMDIDQQSSISSNSDKVPPDATDLVTNELVTDNKSEIISKSVIKDYDNHEKNIIDVNENKKLEEAAVFDKNSNTSTQEFFINASFSSIDRLCSSIVQENKSSLTNKSDVSQGKSKIKKENEPVDVDDDVLERVAAIKRNQKPVRRSTDINHTVIPKEVFSSSARELEIANAQFNREKKETFSQPVKSTSFIKFSALEVDLEKNEKSLKSAESHQQFNEAVPPEFVDDWNAVANFKMNSNVVVKEEKSSNMNSVTENLMDKPTVSNKLLKGESEGILLDKSTKNELPNLSGLSSKNENGFSTANGKGIVISEDKISNYSKIYSEIEKENLNENAFIGLKKRKSDRLQHNSRQNNIFTTESTSSATINTLAPEGGKLKKAEKLRLFEELDLQEFLEPKFSADSSDITDDGFTTAGGKDIKICEEKENYFSNFYNELDDIDESSLSSLKTKKKSSLKLIKKPTDKAVVIFNNRNNSNNTNDLPDASENKIEMLDPPASDGFATAGGKKINVDDEKESYYSSIYKEMDDVDENSLSSLKTKKRLPLKLNKKPTDKAVIVFNNENKTKDPPTTSENKTERVDPPASDGFATAGGKKINVDDEKESYYSSIYKELDDVDENSLSSLKTKKRISLKLNKKPTDKAVIMFNNKKQTKDPTTSENKTERVDPPASDGFATAGGKKINVDDEKESYYSSIYKEMDDVDENSLSSLKTKKRLPLNLGKKPMDKAVVTFNKNQNSSITKSTTSSIVKNETVMELLNTESTSDGFSTAGGKNIAINPEKEKFYSKMYTELSQEIIDENSLLGLNEKKITKIKTKDHQSANKLSTVTNEKKKGAEDAKLTISSDTDDVFYNLGDLEQLFQTSETEKMEVDRDNCFAVPNASHISKKTNQLSSLPKTTLMRDENIIDMGDSTMIRTSSPLVRPENRPLPKSHINMLKRKLEACEPKRPERSRSFGGFPVSAGSANLQASKLNKSDPDDDPNQPLQKGLSVSQQFDSHSDSWLSKIEISYLNNSKTKSPDNKKTRKVDSKESESAKLADDCWKSGQFGDLPGFSFRDSTESFRRYSSFQKFLKNQRARYDRITDLYIHSGETISISNETSTSQHLSVQHSSDLDVKKSSEEYSRYVLVQASPVESPSECINKPALETIDECRGKRKHVDTDSDTPLTTIKKPRVGPEIHGKRLFSDESDEVEKTNRKLTKQKDDGPPSSKKSQVQLDVVDQNFIEKRREAIQQQENTIKSKRLTKVKSIVGTLLQERLVNSKNRKSWSDFVGDSAPTARDIEEIKQNHPDAKVLEITASNATCYQFTSSNILGNKRIVSLDVGDGASLIFDENGHAGVTEFTNAFLAMPGVDPKLLPTGWIENHYRWIVWKLASIDRMHFNSVQLPKALKPKRVMQELKYRYDREIDRAQRPALRRILEKDDVPSRRMVLCISSIQELNTIDEAEKEARLMLGLPRWKVEATDGWYNIPLTLDNVMTNNILNGNIKEGTKIITYGAELLECERGFYPLEKPANVSLKLYSNCSRRARWDTKLGFQSSSRPIPVKLKSIIPSGGLVGQVTVVAARVYPLLYREKTASGQSIYRNARGEEKAANAYERDCELKMDAMYAEAQKSFDSKKKSDSDEELELSQMTPESQLNSCKQNHMERKQEQFKQKLQSRVQEGLPPPRQVTPVLKVRLVDDRSTATLSIWGASEDSSYDIKEGNTITIYNAFASNNKTSELSLTANRFTHIKTETLLKLPYPIRTYTPISDVMTSSLFEPEFNEFDTVGIVVSCGPAPYGMKNFEVANLAYPKPNDAGTSFLSILFWGGISSFGYQSLFTAGTIVAGSNLEWRRNSSWSVAVAYCSEKSVFTCNPRQAYLSKEIRNLKDLVQNPVAYAESCADEIQTELSKKPKIRSNQSTPTGLGSDRMSFHNNSSLMGPQDSPAGMSIKRRLEKLSQYGGNMSDISPSIVLNNSSTRVKNDFMPVAPPRNHT